MRFADGLQSVPPRTAARVHAVFTRDFGNASAYATVCVNPVYQPVALFVHSAEKLVHHIEAIITGGASALVVCYVVRNKKQ